MGSLKIDHVLEDPKHGGSKPFVGCCVAETKCGISSDFDNGERKFFKLIHHMSNDNMGCCGSNRLIDIAKRGTEWKMGHVGHSFLDDKGTSLLFEV